jgi:hypothetical protein
MGPHLDGWMYGFSKWVLTPQTQEEKKRKRKKKKKKKFKKENSTLQKHMFKKREKTLIHETLIGEIGPALYKEPWQGPLFFKIFLIIVF